MSLAGSMPDFILVPLSLLLCIYSRVIVKWTEAVDALDVALNLRIFGMKQLLKHYRNYDLFAWSNTF